MCAQSQQNFRDLKAKEEQGALTRAGTSCFTSCSYKRLLVQCDDGRSWLSRFIIIKGIAATGLLSSRTWCPPGHSYHQASASTAQPLRTCQCKCRSVRSLHVQHVPTNHSSSAMRRTLSLTIGTFLSMLHANLAMLISVDNHQGKCRATAGRQRRPKPTLSSVSSCA